MPNFARPDHYADLEAVTTASEAAKRWHVGYKTVIYAIDSGNVAAVKRGGVWLLSVRSCERWFNRKNRRKSPKQSLKLPQNQIR